VIKERMIKNFISTTEAMKIASTSRPCIIKWCRDFDVGAKVGGRWRVNKEKLFKFLKGEHTIVRKKEKSKRKQKRS